MPLAITWCAGKLEWGLTHAIPATADWLEFHDERSADLEAKIVILAEAIEHMAHDSHGEPEYPFPDPLEHSGEFDEPAFLAEVEAADETAIARIRAALRSGASFAALEGALVRAALSHYAGFGHALIYVAMVGRLIDRLGDAVAEPALAALVRNFISATREDLIPEFRGLAAAVESFPTHATLDGPDLEDADASVEALLAASLRGAFEWVHEHAARHGLRSTWDTLMRASALSMLRFDLDQQDAVAVKVADNVGWLDFTHALTFGSAVRAQCTRDPALWGPGLLQMACFCARNRRFRAPNLDLDRWRVSDEQALFADIDARLLDHDMPLPVYPAHILKTRRAVARELGHVGPATRPLLLAALNRFVHSPIRQRNARRTVHQAIALIGPG